MSMSMVAHVRDFAKSRGDAKFLLLTIASHVNPTTGEAFPSLETLAYEITKGKPYTIQPIRALETLGELEVRRGHSRGHANHYRIALWYEPPRDRSAQDEDDQPKGNPRGDHFSEEKIIEGAKKVIAGGLKGHRSGYSKAVLHTRKQIFESADR